MNALLIHQDANGTHLSNVVTPSNHVNHLIIPNSGTAETITVPVGADYVVFQSFNEFYVNIDEAAAIPTADVTDGSGSIPVPLGLFVRPGQVLSVVSSESPARISLLFYSRG